MQIRFIPGWTWVLVLLLAVPPVAWAASSNDMALLSRGEVLIHEASKKGAEDGPARVEAKILIPRPPDEVWPVVSNPQRLMREEKKVKQVKTLSKSGNVQNVAYSVFLNRLLPVFNYTLRQEARQPHLVEFHRISGSFKDFDGYWRLTPVENGEKTILTYALSLDPGFLCPRFLVIQAVKSDLPSMMKNVKAAIDKQATASR